MQFYPADWRKDPQLQMCGMATQGIWINLICLMWESENEGEITGTTEEICRLVGSSKDDFEGFLRDINRHKFGDVTKCNTDYTITCRRLKKIVKEREGTKERVAKHRQSKDVTNCNNVSSSSSSSSVTSTKKKESKQKPFIPPTIKEVKTYIQEKRLSVEAKRFLDYYTESDWKDNKGKHIKNWKLKLLSWDRYSTPNGNSSPASSTSGPMTQDHPDFYKTDIKKSAERLKRDALVEQQKRDGTFKIGG